ncbi:hypothetical protein CDL15_Pgr013735 [Punica granatum]|uniref:Fe2OG dioxygenase domain-containing protein n=1 Tax=Punica granatum TaxID=22663 RepID=A0A218W226_PUNGR|nr:hypothetical protein CDL15_Pgr013735 [Punica granatum]
MGEEGRVVPVIDMQELPFHYAKLREACQEWGCFRVVNHGVPVVLMSEMKRVGRSLLDLPIETKKQNVEVRPGSGYIAPGKVNAIYESLYLSDLASPEFVPAFCSQLDADPENRMSCFRHCISQSVKLYYMGNISAFQMLKEDIGQYKVAKSLDLSGGSNLFERWPCHMRMNKYSFAPETVGNCGVPVHSDSSFLTLLQDDDAVGGLEIFDNKSGSFLAVQPCPSTFFVNLGDLAVVWSNGRFSSVKHQVQCTEGKVRVSIGTFMFTPGDAVVEAPEELIDSQNPRLYVPFTCGHYRKLRGEKKMAASCREVRITRIYAQVGVTHRLEYKRNVRFEKTPVVSDVGTSKMGLLWVMNPGVPVMLMSEMKGVVRLLLDLPIKTKNQMKSWISVLGTGALFKLFSFWPRILSYGFYFFAVINGMYLDDDVVGGLEVVDNKSGSFVAVQPCPDTFFLNAWSNGRFHSLKHQVQSTESEVLVSIGMFMFTPQDVVVESPEELVDSQNPRLYVPFTGEDYMKLRHEKKTYTDEALLVLLNLEQCINRKPGKNRDRFLIEDKNGKEGRGGTIPVEMSCV